jgi:hypothetical protein
VPLLALKHSGNGSKVINQKLLPFNGKVYLCDEFTNYYDVSVGIDALNYY